MAGEKLDPKVEDIIGRILEAREDTDRQTILAKIKEKKEQIGSGYLTDLGALYLLMSDWDIKLEHAPATLKVGEAKGGLNGVTIEGYFLSMGMELAGNRGVEFYMFDSNVRRCIAWGRSSERIKALGLATGKPLSIAGCSTKLSRDGSVEVHLNDRSAITVSDAKGGDITSICVDDYRPNGLHIYRGRISGPVKGLHYKKRDQSEGSAISFNLSMKTNGSIRVVIWGRTDGSLSDGTDVVVGPLMGRQGKYGIELAGNEGTVILKRLHKYYIIGESEDRFLALDEALKPYILTTTMKRPLGGNTIETTGPIVRSHFVHIGDIAKITSEDLVAVLERSLIKVKEARQGLVNIEAVVLSIPKVNLHKLPDGRASSMTEVLVGDDTGDIKLVSSSNQHEVSSLKLGERIRVLGGDYNDVNGTIEIRAYSKVERVARA